MLDFIDDGLLFDLEASIPSDILDVAKQFTIRGKTRVGFYKGIVSIIDWYAEHHSDLKLLNECVWAYTPLSTVFQLINDYFRFLNSLSYKKLSDIGIGSKQWEWYEGYVKRTYNFSLQIDRSKVLQLKKLCEKQKRQVLMRKQNTKKHISLDCITPEEVYSFLNRG